MSMSASAARSPKEIGEKAEERSESAAAKASSPSPRPFAALP
jgi:hypothetical protein